MGERLSNMSRGQRMQAALLCALAPRPALLLLDEPFTGLDLSAKDAIVRAVLELAADEQWTVVVATHDVSEIEMLADWVGFLRDGRIDVSEPLDVLRARHRAGGESPVTLRDLYLTYGAVSTGSRRSA
jgi:ABC-type multidrug transport system ATPase subunit